MGLRIKNQAGDNFYLRGMNVENTMKDIEGYLIDVSDEDIATLKESGITMIRLLTFWTAIYPEDGQLDEGVSRRLYGAVRAFYRCRF